MAVSVHGSIGLSRHSEAHTQRFVLCFGDRKDEKQNI